MLRISSEKLPKLVIYDLSYLIYYSIYWFLLSILLINPLSQIYLEGFTLKNDYEILAFSIILWILLWVIYKIITPSIKKRLIKRNIFIAWIIKALKKKEKLSFWDILDNYSYFLFQSKKFFLQIKNGYLG